MPATETEDEWMGDTRDRLKDHASEAGREQLAKVGAAAGAAYDAAREEADRQGLTPEAAVAGAGSMAEKVDASLRRRATPRKPRPSARSSGRPRQTRLSERAKHLVRRCQPSGPGLPGRSALFPLIKRHHAAQNRTSEKCRE